MQELMFIRNVESSSFLRRLLWRAEVDRSVVFLLFSRAWALGSGPLTVLLIASHLTRELQGYYYTFASLLALQSFLDLGLCVVIIQFASHEWADLGLDNSRRIVGSPYALGRLAGLCRFAVAWYAVVACGFVLVVGSIGYWFFSAQRHPDVSWQLPWWVLVTLTGSQLGLQPLVAILEGCRQVGTVYLFRFVQIVLGTVGLWIALVWHPNNLLVTSVVPAVNVLVTLSLVAVRYRSFFEAFRTRPAAPQISWRRELVPMQWRLALESFALYFASSLFTPVVFRSFGPAIAGQMGMTLSLVGAVGSVGYAWMQGKPGRFGALIAKQQYAALDSLFFRSAGVSLLATLSCGVAAWVAVGLLYAQHHALAMRILPPLPTGIFLAAAILMHVSQCESVYLRAHKREPLLAPSLVASVLIGILVWYLGGTFGPLGEGLGYLSVVALVIVPWETWIWVRCRALWHSPGYNGSIAIERVELDHPSWMARCNRFVACTLDKP